MEVARQKYSKPEFRGGIKALHEPDNATVDICFVHGLTGDRETTWTAAGKSEPWPTTLLPPILPQARILTFGYDAYFVSSQDVSTNGLDQHALSLVYDLSHNRRKMKARGRPLIFVAHSLGGIVCKEAILKAKSPPPNNAHWEEIYESVEGIAFLGTPHRGAWQAKWAAISVSTLGYFIRSANEKLLDVLRIGNELNERTNANFAGALHERQRNNRPVQVTCFSEELPMKHGGTIVERASASLDNALTITIHANHRDMVKFSSSEDTGFERLSGELERWIEECEHRTSQEVSVPSREPDRHILEEPSTQKCLRDLSPTIPEDDRKRIENTKGGLMTDICEWIFDTSQFRAWERDSDKKTLWIRGDPGKGKTMLISAIITKLVSQNRPVSYFFCQATNDMLNTALGVLRGLVYSLIMEKPRLVSYLCQIYDRRGKDMFDDTNGWYTLLDIFSDMCCDEAAEDVVFIVDGLDECVTDRQNLFQLFTDCKARWIFSSRNSLEIVEEMRLVNNILPLSLELNEDTVDGAVLAYIRKKVDILARKKAYDEATKQYVHNYLAKHAHGTFLWVSIVCEVLSRRTGKNSTQASLEALPAGLVNLYKVMMSTIMADTSTAPESLSILRIVAVAFRPLSLRELATLLYPDGSSGGKLDSLVESIRQCASFIIIRSTLGQDNVDPDSIVQFVHQSAKDYLIDMKSERIIPSGIRQCHFELGLTSLTALTTLLVSGWNTDPGSLSQDFQSVQKTFFASVKYPCVFWDVHLQESGLAMQEWSKLSSILNKFLQTKRFTWLEAMVLLGQIDRARGAIVSVMTMLPVSETDTAALLRDANALVVEYYDVSTLYQDMFGMPTLQSFADHGLGLPSFTWILTAAIRNRRSGLKVYRPVPVLRLRGGH